MNWVNQQLNEKYPQAFVKMLRFYDIKNVDSWGIYYDLSFKDPKLLFEFFKENEIVIKIRNRFDFEIKYYDEVINGYGNNRIETENKAFGKAFKILENQIKLEN